MPFRWILVLGLVGFTQAGWPAEPVPKRPYPPLWPDSRFNDDFSALGNPEYQPVEPRDFWDPVKWIALDAERGIHLSIGGEARLAYEMISNASFGAGPQDDGRYLMHRYLLHADLRLTPAARVFAQLQSSLLEGRRGGPRPTDRDELDLHQAFAEWTPWREDGFQAGLRVGRQELNYGSSRILTFREGPNNRLSFEAAKVMLSGQGWLLDAFAGRPLETDARAFDNQALETQSIWGLYSVLDVPALPSWQADLYFLGYDRDPARFNEGAGGETRYSWGTRLHGRKSGWDWNFEGLYQFGDYGGGTISAWTLASDTGHTWTDAPGRPRLGLKANIASGDEERGDGDLGTFNALYPRGAYFGEIGLIGPANFINLHPSLTLQPARGWRLHSDVVFFWRESTEDGVYGPGGNLIRPAGTSRARYVGTQVDFSASWQVDPHWSVSVEYGHFFTGSFLRETGPAEDVDFVQVKSTYRF